MRAVIWASLPGEPRVSISTLRSVVCIASVAACVAACVVAYWPTYAVIFDYWRTSYYYSHGWLVGAAALWLCVRCVPDLLRRPPASHALMLAGLIGAVSIWLVSYIGTFERLQYLAVLLVLVFAVASLFGARGVRALAVPILAGLTVLPIWSPATRLLQPMTVVLVELATTAIGIPVFVSEHSVHLRYGTIDILTGCSGLQALLFSVALALIVGELCAMRRTERLGLLGYCVAASVVANCLRIVTIAVLGHYTDMQHPMVRDHGIFGHAYFGMLVLLPLGIIIWRSPSFEIFPREKLALVPARLDVAWRTLIPVALIVLTLPAAARAWDFLRADGLAVEIETATPAPGWSRSEAPFPWQTLYAGAAAEVTMSYRAPAGADVDVYGVTYIDQSSHGELISFTPRIAPRFASASLRRGPRAVVEAHVETDSGDRWLLWYWYRIGERETTSPVAAKLMQLRGWFARGTPSSLFAFAAKCDVDCAGASALLEEFARAHGEFHPVRAGANNGEQHGS